MLQNVSKLVEGLIADAIGYVEGPCLESLIRWGTPLDELIDRDVGLACFRTKCLHLYEMLGHQAEGFASLKLEVDVRENQVKILGALMALRDLIREGLFVKIERLVTADVFDDLLAQADHLQKHGYSIPAGSIARAVLERHLRDWCAVVGIGFTKPHPTIGDYNTELYKAGNYAQHPMQQVTAMAVIANDAAHARLENKDFGQVDTLLRDVREFITKYYPS